MPRELVEKLTHEHLVDHFMTLQDVYYQAAELLIEVELRAQAVVNPTH